MISKSFLNLDLNESNTKLYNDDKEKLIKKQRRSRHCQEGRQFKCEKCNKSYLSKPALLNHMFKKHKDILNENLIKKREEVVRKILKLLKIKMKNQKIKIITLFFYYQKENYCQIKLFQIIMKMQLILHFKFILILIIINILDILNIQKIIQY